MSLLTRKRAILAKIETSYGTDATPTGSANAILLKNLNVNPISAETVSRDLIRAYLGNSEALLAQKFVTLDFEVEAAGAGVAGKAPAYDALLRMCGLGKSYTDAAISITRTSGVATATLAAHGYAVGDKVTISGATETEYNGEQTITAVTTNTFSYPVTGSPATPATGSPIIRRNVKYSPLSGSFESGTIYYLADSESGTAVLHKATGCFGSFELGLSVKNIPSFKFTFVGIYNAPVDTTMPAADYTGFKTPYVANTQNTPGATLFGYSGKLENLSVNIQNDVQYISLIGSESVKLLNRQPSGQLVMEAPTIATKDFFTLVSANTSGALSISHGPSTGHKVLFDAPSVLLGNPTYQDSNGIQMLSCPFTVNPVAGNDEFTLTVA